MVVYKCEKCEKEFNHKGDYTRHINKKISCINSDKKYTERENELIELVRKLTAKVENMEKELSEFKNNEKTIINNINATINVNIVAFGKENLNFLTEEQRKLLVTRGLKSVEKYVEIVHFNKDKPEYNNIYVSNIKNSHILVYDGNAWKIRGNEIIDDLRDKGIEYIEETYEELKNNGKFKESFVKRMDKVFKRFDTDEELKSKISKDIRIILYNERPTKKK